MFFLSFVIVGYHRVLLRWGQDIYDIYRATLYYTWHIYIMIVCTSEYIHTTEYGSTAVNCRCFTTTTIILLLLLLAGLVELNKHGRRAELTHSRCRYDILK